MAIGPDRCGVESDPPDWRANCLRYSFQGVIEKLTIKIVVGDSEVGDPS